MKLYAFKAEGSVDLVYVFAETTSAAVRALVKDHGLQTWQLVAVSK